MNKTVLLLAAPILGATLSAQSQSVSFSDPSGLSAEAEFTLLDMGSTLEIRVRNTSTGGPMGFEESDQLLTGISFDLGAAGANASDPQITGGSVKTGLASMSINFDVMDVGPDEDVSGEYGYGNGGATGMLPNLVTGNQANATPFGGLNLDGPDGLNGPQGGLVANPPLVGLVGLGAIQDEIVATLQLDAALADLGFLANGAIVEYGSDAAFVGDDCDEDASVVQIDDPGGLNLSGGLAATPGSLPTRGNPNWCLDMDDVNGLCVTPGAMTFVFLSFNTAAFRVPRFGCAPGSAGEIMIDPTVIGLVGGPLVWNGPGQPATHCFAIPDDPSVCGLLCFGQGLFLDPQGASAPGILTNRVDITIGS